ncbi:hypothetical protein [Nocardioides gilvus]|uniref:hypothetical protein n=1 Tax=Nocardioides gilvus TaxID=1735589 RepID=UPI000D742D20|nr:hypothetical protein [Nocardioides gilvus]
MTTPRFVWVAVALAVSGRFAGCLWPLRPDEAGFLLVARAWDPQPDALFHPYFVDRPPSLVALVRLVDLLGGPYALRVVGAAACAAAVLLVAALVRELARHLSVRVAVAPLHLVTVGAALLTAAFLVNPQIDAVGVKGELLGVPVVLASCLVALMALRRRSLAAAAAAGFLAMAAVGLKQSLVGGLVFGAVLLLVACVTKRLSLLDTTRLATAALLGGCVPVALTVGWAVAAGVELATLEYAVIGFRSDASAVIVAQSNAANASRIGTLLLVFAGTGMALVLLWCLARLRIALRHVPAPVVAAVVMLVVDLTVIALSGSFWRPYLFPLVAPLMVLWACVRVADLPDLRHGDSLALRASGTWRPRREVVLVALCVGSSIVSLAVWTSNNWRNGDPPRQYEVGRAIAEVAEADETLVVYGGRADLQWASGLDSPYEHLWSLPMRTMDPELARLRSLLAGPEAPEWFVTTVGLGAWDGIGQKALSPVLESRYVDLGVECEGVVVRRRADAPEVATPTPDCETPLGRR